MADDWSVIDPNSLVLAKGEDFNGLPGEDTWVSLEGWEAVSTMCRAWYDAKNHGKAYCCQGNAAGEDGVDPESAGVIDSSEVTAAEPIQLDFGGQNYKLTPYAEAFKSAVKLGGVAVIMTTITLMQ